MEVIEAPRRLLRVPVAVAGRAEAEEPVQEEDDEGRAHEEHRRPRRGAALPQHGDEDTGEHERQGDADADPGEHEAGGAATRAQSPTSAA